MQVHAFYRPLFGETARRYERRAFTLLKGLVEEEKRLVEVMGEE